MDAHEHESSYYEVALTNRQVVGGFVILLACLFAAFLSGVWLGRGGGVVTPGPALAAMTPAPEAGERKLEQLSFFADGATPAEANVPRPSPQASESARPPAADPTPAVSPAAAAEAEKLRRTLEAEMAEHRTDAPQAADAAPPTTSAAAGTRIRRQTEATAPAPQPAAAAPADPAAAASVAPTWIQVYSSPDGVKARELAGRLGRNRFETVVLEAESGGGTTYRVRVGPYAQRADAERAASRLRREFRLDTWITDQP